jgi:glycosyltransferase involved in cell wall biosynthesis
MPEVSIILPTYNRYKTLKRAVDSVLNQTYDDFELIIVDDGSTDDTEKLINGIMQLDRRVKYKKLDKNFGAYKARNEGILILKGRFIAFQDSDDEWIPDKLIKQVSILKSFPEDIGMVYCFMCEIDENGNKRIMNKEIITPEMPDLHRKTLMYMCDGIDLQACLFRREVFETCGYFDENLKTTGDKEYLIRISKKYKFYCINEPLLNYHSTSGSFSKNRPEILKSYIYIFNKYYDEIKNDWIILSKHYFKISRRYKWVGDSVQAKKFKIKAYFFYIFGKLRHQLNKTFKLLQF